MNILVELAKTVVAMGVVAGGVITIGKTKFLTKKDFDRGKDTCRREMITKVDAVRVEQKIMSERSREDMEEIKFFMGEVSKYMELMNGRG